MTLLENLTQRIQEGINLAIILKELREVYENQQNILVMQELKVKINKYVIQESLNYESVE